MGLSKNCTVTGGSGVGGDGELNQLRQNLVGSQFVGWDSFENLNLSMVSYYSDFRRGDSGDGDREGLFMIKEVHEGYESQE
jgi:hypothetical protein